MNVSRFPLEVLTVYLSSVAPGPTLEPITVAQGDTTLTLGQAGVTCSSSRFRAVTFLQDLSETLYEYVGKERIWCFPNCFDSELNNREIRYTALEQWLPPSHGAEALSLLQSLPFPKV